MATSVHRPIAAAAAPTLSPSTQPLFSSAFASLPVGEVVPGWTAARGIWAICAPKGTVNAYCQTSYANSVAIAQHSWSNFQVDAVAYNKDFRYGGIAVLGRVQNATQYYQLELKKSATAGLLNWFLAKSDGSVWTTFASGLLPVSTSYYYHLKLAFFGSQITAWHASATGSDYEFLGSAYDSQFPTGSVGLRTTSDASARFDKVSVTGGNSAIALVGAPEIPAPADSFVNSVGLNTNVYSMRSASVAAMAAATRTLGVRHVRVAVLRGATGYTAKLSTFLTLSGTLALGLTDCPQPLGQRPLSGITASDIRAFNAAIGGRIEAYEAVNEPDIRGADPKWAPDTISCMRPQVGALAGVPFLAPALAIQLFNATRLGNVSALVTHGNAHRYFSGNNPGTTGWGGANSCGNYGALSWAICETSINSGSKPMMITETGYGSTADVDEPTQAKYLSRELYVNNQAGIRRTYIYCLNSYTGGDGFGSFGLLELNLTPKPAYMAIEHELALFEDPGVDSGARAPLVYSFGAGVATIRHELFQKRDGTYLLAAWNETSSWNPIARVPVFVPSSAVIVTLPFAPTTAIAESLNDSGNFMPIGMSVSGSSIIFPVDDHMTIFEFKR